MNEAQTAIFFTDNETEEQVAFANGRSASYRPRGLWLAHRWGYRVLEQKQFPGRVKLR